VVVVIVVLWVTRTGRGGRGGGGRGGRGRGGRAGGHYQRQDMGARQQIDVSRVISERKGEDVRRGLPIFRPVQSLLYSTHLRVDGRETVALEL
jgi:hypothetical protein